MSVDKPKTPRPLTELMREMARRSSTKEVVESSNPYADMLGIGLIPPPPPAPPHIRDRWFKDQVVHIDGYVFERCRFDRCKLITEIATFSFLNSYISPDCALYFQGPCLKVVRLLLHHLEGQGRVVRQHGEEGIFVTPNSDGTFSLD